MLKRPFLPILLVVLASGAQACVPDEEPTDALTIQQAIAGGSIDRDHPAVVGIGQVQNGYVVGACSGTLIAPNLVLTAQHCVASTGDQIRCGYSNFGSTMPASRMKITTNTYLTNGYAMARPTFDVAEIFTGNKDDVCGNDIALMLLEENVDEDVATPIVPRIDVAVYPGEDYTAIGYGHTGNGQDSGVRRILEGRRIQCEGVACPNYVQVEFAEFLGSSGTCQGDSGGPALDRKGRVLGALSRGVGNCESSTYSSVEGWAEWMMEQGMLAAERGGYEPPFWAEFGVSEIPENDADLDGVLTQSDNCPDVFNEDQIDSDEDGLGDACDENSDTDSVLDVDDNCPTVANDNQADFDGDGAGDACDDDDDDDGVIDDADACPTNPKFTDFGADCSITGDDLIIVAADDKGCATAGGAPSTLAGLLMVLGLFWRPRRRRG